MRTTRRLATFALSLATVAFAGPPGRDASDRHHSRAFQSSLDRHFQQRELKPDQIDKPKVTPVVVRAEFVVDPTGRVHQVKLLDRTTDNSVNYKAEKELARHRFPPSTDPDDQELREMVLRVTLWVQS
jgi:hypothetical protein